MTDGREFLTHETGRCRIGRAALAHSGGTAPDWALGRCDVMRSHAPRAGTGFLRDRRLEHSRTQQGRR
jgi:hypothetical protein